MSVDPHHPTLHLASDLRPGWTVLHLGRTNNNQLVTGVETVEGVVYATVVDGTRHGWAPDDRVHAAPPAE